MNSVSFASYEDSQGALDILVINGCPFYQARDDNNHHFEGTWYFFSGVFNEEVDNRQQGNIIGASQISGFSTQELFGHRCRHYIKETVRLKKPELICFADLSKMCFSASLGGGYWTTPKGRLLRKYLIQHHKALMLTSIQVSVIFNAKRLDEINKLEGPEALNTWLSADEQGFSSAGSCKVSNVLTPASVSRTLAKQRVESIHYHHHHHYHYHHYEETPPKLVMPNCGIL